MPNCFRPEKGQKKNGFEYARNIEEAAGRLSSLISNILRLNKLEHQQIDPEIEPYDLCGQLEECILNYEEMWDEKDLDLEVDMEEKTVVEGDKSLMELVWNNLLSNAIKFTEPGGRVAVRQTFSDGYAVVEVTDTGCGMSKENIRHIFDKFYQEILPIPGKATGWGLPSSDGSSS